MSAHRTAPRSLSLGSLSLGSLSLGSLPLARIAKAGIVALFAVPVLSVFAQTTGPLPQSRAAKERSPSALGSYLAGRIARNENDIVSAARLYRQTLEVEPANEAVLGQAFEMATMEGDFPRAVGFAKTLVEKKADNRLATTLAALDAFKAGKFAEAEDLFKSTAGNPVGDLTATLGRAWAKQAQGQTKDALELLDQTKGADSIQGFYRYHRALLADVANRRSEARTAFERASRGGENKTLRFALAYAQHLSNAGDTKAAQGILQAQIDRSRGEGHPLVRAYVKQLEGGEKLPLIVSTPAQGLSEGFYGLGEALIADGGLGASAVFLQYALFLDPNAPFALATLANVFEGAKRYELANATYLKIPKGTPLETSIEIRRALNLNAIEKVSEAQELLDGILKREPNNVVVLDTLGSVMRGHKRYDEAIGYYSRAIATLNNKPEPRHWTLFYARGTSYERVKKWPLAEVDLQQALKLAPDQAQVLNYLGYTWVDMGRNLKQGLALVEKAVRLKPDDGYITDSLGWAHYKLGNFKDAAKWLEKAVELRPDDPILNDHLGDAYWRTGREREARFQWEQALTLKPEPDDAEKINKKLKGGLPPVAQAKQPQRPTRQVQGTDAPKRRTDVRPSSNPVQ